VKERARPAGRNVQELTNALGDAFAVLVSVDAKVSAISARTLLASALERCETASIGLLVADGLVESYARRPPIGELESVAGFPVYDPLETERLALPTPLTPRDLDILFRCHSVLRDIDGLHADECLDELSKLIFAKIWDEIHADGKPMFRLRGANTEEAASVIRSLYARAREQLVGGLNGSRGVFSVPLSLSSPAILEVVGLLQDFNLSQSRADLKGMAFQQVINAAMRAGMGQYFTPEPVIQLIVEMLDPSPGDLVLDPFCGSARFLRETLSHQRRGGPGRGRASARLHGIEKSDRMVRIALTDALLHEDQQAIKIWRKDSLLRVNNYDRMLGRPAAGAFDLVMTNPPFGSLLSTGALDRLDRFELAEGRENLPLEVIGLERSLQFMKAGGRMAIVLPESVLTNRRLQFVRDWLVRHARLLAVVSLPPQTFAPFDGVAKTSVLFAQKDVRGDDLDYPVFIARAEHVGYDNTNRLDSKNDLLEIAPAFRSWSERGALPKGTLWGTQTAASLVTNMAATIRAVPTTTPKGWRRIRLGDLAEAIFEGDTPPRSTYTADGHRILKVRDLTNEGLNWEPRERGFVSESLFQRRQNIRLREGDLLLTAAAHNPGYIGKKVDIVDRIPEVYSNGVLCTRELLVIRPRVEAIDPYLLLLYLRSQEGYRALQSCVVGQTAHIYEGEISEISVPVPDEISPDLAAAVNALKEGLKLRAEFKARMREALRLVAGYLPE